MIEGTSWSLQSRDPLVMLGLHKGRAAGLRGSYDYFTTSFSQVLIVESCRSLGDCGVHPLGARPALSPGPVPSVA
jgi:hypothetical protein